MKKLMIAALLAVLPASALAMATSSGEVDQGTTPVARAAYDSLTTRYTCSQRWLADKPQYSTAKKAQAQHYGRASLAYARDNSTVFIAARDSVVGVITSLRIPC